MEQNHQLSHSTGPLFENVVGQLIYLTFTRPDLAYFVHILSKFLNAPQKDHWDAAIRVVR